VETNKRKPNQTNQPDKQQTNKQDLKAEGNYWGMDGDCGEGKRWQKGGHDQSMIYVCLKPVNLYN
jgi:hypothetical protein